MAHQVLRVVAVVALIMTNVSTPSPAPSVGRTETMDVFAVTAETGAPPDLALGTTESDDTTADGPAPAKTADLSSVPLHFEANAGQMNAGVDFIARGSSYAVYLGGEGMVVSLKSRKAPDKSEVRRDGTRRRKADPFAAPELKSAVVGMRLLGANADTRTTGFDELPGRVNYYVGDDPEHWRSDIATFAKVRYQDVYPGVDLVYYGNQRKLEYDFVVAPGADPGVIALDVEGTDQVELDADGDLVLHTPDGPIRQQQPLVYQELDGLRRSIDGRYVLDGYRVTFALGAYDPSLQLIIDPTLAYSSFFGGDGEDPAYGIAVDPAGNLYFTGVTGSMSSPPGANNFPLFNTWGAEGAVCCGGNDTGRVYVTKMTPDNKTLIFSTYLGGFAGFGGVHQKCPEVQGCGGAPGFARGWDTGHSIAADSAGNAYVAGWAESLDFPTTADATRKSHPGPIGCTEPTCYAHTYKDHPRDAFVAKFGPTGALVYSSLIGGRGSDGGMAIDVVDSGVGMGVYVGGLAQSPDFFADDSLSPSGGSQHYPAVASFMSSLNVLTPAQGGYVTTTTPPPACQGATTSSDWSCWRDGFLIKLDYNSLKNAVFSTLIGGTADDGLYGINVDRNTGAVIVVGETESTDFPTITSALQPCLGGDGGYHAEPTLAHASDTHFLCHLTPTPGVGDPDSIQKPNVDAFVARFSPTGAAQFITYLGGSMDDNSGATLDDLAGDFGRTVALDDAGNIYVTGWTESTSTPIAMCGASQTEACPHKVPFPTTPTAYMTTMPQDPTSTCPTPGCEPPNRHLHAVSYVTKLKPDGTGILWSTYLGGYGDDAAFGIAVDSAGQAYVTGVAESVNFPGAGNGAIPGFPNTAPIGKYIAHPGCPDCGKYLGGILPPYDPFNLPQASDAFVVKMKADGTAPIYSSYLGASGDEVVHGIVHSTRNGKHGIYASGLTTSQNVPPPNPPPPDAPFPSPWYAFPVTPDAFQATHKVGRTVRCDGGPATSEKDDYPCPPLPANPSEDAFIVRLDDNDDELPAPPVGVGQKPTTPDFSVETNPKDTTTINLAGAGAGTGSFAIVTTSFIGFADPVVLNVSVLPLQGLNISLPPPACSSDPNARCYTVAPTTTTPTVVYPNVPVSLTSSTPGKYDITITGTASGRVRVAKITVNVVAPDFALTPNPAKLSFAQMGGTGSFKIGVTGVGGISAPVTITPTPTANLTFNPASTTANPGADASFTVTATQPGVYNVTFTGSCTNCAFPSGNLSHTTTMEITARPVDFSVTTNPKTIIYTSDPGGKGTFQVTTTPIDGFNLAGGVVNFSQTSTPPGLTVKPITQSPSGPPGYPAVTYEVSGTSPNVYTMTITATSSGSKDGVSWSLSHDTVETIIVPTNTGFRDPTANTTANSSGDGDGFEGTPTAAYKNDESPAHLYAADRNSGGSTDGTCAGENKDSHIFYNYGFAIPAGAKITGIEVRLDSYATSTASAPPFECVELSWGGAVDGTWTSFKQTPTLTGTEDTYILGGADDTWNHLWTTTELGNPSFRLRITNVAATLSANFFLDWVAVKVHYTGQPTTSTAITSDLSVASVVGQVVPVSFKVTPLANTGTPTGSVTVSTTPASADSCSATLDATGSGTCNITFTSAGAKSVIATYTSNGPFSGSVSPAKPHQVDKANTTTAIKTHTPDPSVAGQAVNVTVSVLAVAPGAGIPSGTVTVSDNTFSCVASLAQGDGACSVSILLAGAKNLTAAYSGDANYNASTSTPPTAHIVNKADTLTTITSDAPDPSVVNTGITVKYTVVPGAPGAGTPTGSVTVAAGTDTCTDPTLSGSCSLTLTSPGAKNLIATYSGDANFNTSTSAGEPHQVDATATLSITIASDDPDPSVVGQPVTVNYTVNGGNTAGSVTVNAVRQGTSTVETSCSGAVSATGTGTCSLTFNTPGNRTLTATYTEGANTATSAGAAHAVNKAGTTTTVSADNPDPSVVGQPVTVNFSVAAAAPGAGAPTGIVTVSAPGAVGCGVPVAQGQCTITFNSAGAQTITATYQGDSNFSTSASAGAPHTVNKADTTTTLSSHTPEQPPDSPDPSVTGQPVIIQFVVAAVFPGSGAPTGTVTVSAGAGLTCTGTVANGQCALTFPAAGTYTLSAAYAGDQNFSPSPTAAPGEPHLVNKADTTTTITADTPDPSGIGQAVPITFTVVANAPGAGTPTGSVTVSSPRSTTPGDADTCTGTVAAGGCSLTFTLAAGARTLNATYAGDANYGGGISADVAHAVNPDSSGTTGLRSPTANSAANTSGDGDGFEVTPANAYVPDGLFAVDNNSGGSAEATCAGQNKDSHRFSAFGITLPAGTTSITGIRVRLNARVDATTGESAAGTTAGDPMMCVALSWNNGSSWTAARSTGPITAAAAGATYILGGPGDTWGRTWTVPQVSNGTLQVRVMNVSTVSTRDFFLDYIAVEVMYR